MRDNIRAAVCDSYQSYLEPWTSRIVNLVRALYLFGGYNGYTIALRTGSFVPRGAGTLCGCGLTKP